MEFNNQAIYKIILSLIFEHIRNSAVFQCFYEHNPNILICIRMLVSNPTVSKRLPGDMVLCNFKNRTFLYKKGLMLTRSIFPQSDAIF